MCKLKQTKEKRLHLRFVTCKTLVLLINFTKKDSQLYERALELWETIEKNDFKPQKTSPIEKKEIAKKPTAEKYIGLVDNINSSFITGWVFRKNDNNTLEVAIYINDELFQELKADIMRPGVKKTKGHPTGYCGFKTRITSRTFQPHDKIEVKVLPNEITLPYGQNAKNYFIT